MYKFLIGWIAALAAVLLLTLRAGVEQQADVVVCNDDEPRSIDPYKASWNHDIRAAVPLFEGLMRLAPATLEPEAGMAESFRVSEDGRTYLFRLRKGARWMNVVRGDLGPVTAHDFVYAWKRVLGSESRSDYYELLFCIKNAEKFHEGELPWAQVGVKALADDLLQVELEHRFPLFLELTAFITFMPVHPPTVEADPDNWSLRAETFAGNGPFLLAERSIFRRIRLVRNETYWDKARVRSRITDVLPIKNYNTALLSYEGGFADFVPTIPPSIAREMERQAKAGRPRPDLHLVQSFGTYFYRYNCKDTIKHADTGKMVPNPMADPRVRLALGLAVDRRSLVNDVLGLGRKPVVGFVPPKAIKGYDGIAYEHGRDYDPKRAGELLDAAGWRDRKAMPPLVISFQSDPMHEDIALYVRESWRKLGLDVRTQGMEGKLFSQTQESVEYVVSRSGWFGDYNDPSTFLDMFTSGNGQNQTGFADEEYDKLMRSARAEEDPAKRMKLMAEAEDILVFRRPPILSIFQYVEAQMARPSLRGYHPNPRGLLDIKYLYKE